MCYADYRKYNDHGMNSSTYHKKDGTPVRAILKEEAREEIMEATDFTPSSVPLFPTMLIRCTQGHEYCAVVPPWESRISDLGCKECGSTADTIQWVGMRPLSSVRH